MEITCLQMDVLLSFYIEGDLSSCLRKKVEEHLKKCPTCRAKYNIISSLYDDLQNSVYDEDKEFSTKVIPSREYNDFKSNLSAYVDNELSAEDNIKIKKYAINNKQARKDLEDTYHIRKLMSDSFRKTKSESNPDLSKKVLKELNIEEPNYMSFNPLVKVAFAFVMTVLALSAIIIFSLSMG